MDEEWKLGSPPPLPEKVEDNDNVNVPSDKTNEPEVEAELTFAERTDEDYSQEIRQMQEIRRTFSSVINEFEKDSSVEKFMNEYNKLYEALKESHCVQKTLMVECANLRCDIKNNAEKVSLAIHLSQEDKEIISNLTKQVNQAWSEVDNLTEKENRAKNVISKLHGEISSLTSLVEAGSGIQELHHVAQKAVAERRELEQALASLKEEMEYRDMRISELTDRMQTKEDNFQKDLNKLKDKLQLGEKKKHELEQRIDDLENDVKFLDRVRSNMIEENTSITTKMDACKTNLTKLEKDQIDLRADLWKATTLNTEQQEGLSEKTKEIVKLTAEKESWKKRFEIMQSSNSMLKENLEEKDFTAQTNERIIRKKETEIEVLAKKGDLTALALKILQRQLLERESQLKEDRESINILRTSLLATETNLNKIDAERTKLQRLTELEQNNNLKLISQKGALETSLVLKNKINHCLSVELNAMGKQVKKGLEAISTMQSDRERLYGRINQILDMVNNLASDNDNKEAKLMILLKLNNEQQVNIHNSNSKLIRMTNKRDNISNTLHLVQLKNEELNVVNLNFGKQSSALAEDLHTQEQVITDMQKRIDHLKDQINTHLNEIQALKDEKTVNLHKINELQGKLIQMERHLCKREQKIGNMSLVVDQIVHQRNVLGYQYTKKMELVKLLTEKNTLMQSLFKAGNRAYNFQLKVINQLKLNIMNLYRQKTILMNKLENIDSLRSKLGLANQQLVAALSRVRALEGEHPYNLHRWRHLKAMDISQYETIIKIQHLQKKVILRTDEVTILERALLDKTTIVQEMKRALERRPGLEIIAKAKSDQEAKEKLDRKLKAAVAEKNLCAYKCDRQVSHNKYILTRLIEEKKKTVTINKANIRLRTKLSKLPDIYEPFIRNDLM